VNYIKIIIPVIVAIVGITIISTISFESSNNEPLMEENIVEDVVEDIQQDELTKEINIFENELKNPEDIIAEKLEDIITDAKEHDYRPKDREWITSGPFQIDRSEYLLGEKIFVRIGGLEYEEKGQIVFLRPLNNTHYSVYLTIPFDGANKSAFNYYLEPQLSKNRELCTAEDFIGDWRVVFRGTDYPNLEFKITEEILPGEEDDYQISVC